MLKNVIDRLRDRGQIAHLVHSFPRTHEKELSEGLLGRATGSEQGESKGGRGADRLRPGLPDTAGAPATGRCVLSPLRLPSSPCSSPLPRRVRGISQATHSLGVLGRAWMQYVSKVAFHVWKSPWKGFKGSTSSFFPDCPI